MPKKKEIVRDKEKAIIKPNGDLVASKVQKLKPEIKSLVDEGVKELIVNLVDVEVIDSVGISLLVAAHNSLSKVGGKLMVSEASNDIKDLFKSMRLDQHFCMSCSE
ncbi:MAG: STAS domain-containing protein [bacterium]